MADPNLGQAAAASLRNRSSEVADSVTNNNAFLAWLKSKGRIETREGGRTYLEPINFAENGTAKFYDGGLESFAISTESNLDASEWSRKFQAGFIYFTESERQSNRGEAAVVRLIDNKIKVLKATLANQMSTALYNDGTTSNEVVGLQAQIADDPTTGTLGGINAATYSWWRNQYGTGTTASASNIESLLDTQWLSTIRGTDRPDLLVAGTDIFTYYKNALGALQRFTSRENANTLDFNSLMYQDAEIVFDPTCNTKRVYGINTNDFTFVCDPGKKWSVGSHRDVTNALYEVVPVSWSGALLQSRRESHFVINGT